MNTDDRATELEVWSAQSNRAVVRMPGRAFPGVVIQGDSLSILFDHAMSIVEGLRKSADTDLRETSEELAEQLFAFVQHYEAVLADRGVDLPYVRDPERVPPPVRHQEAAD